MTDEATVRDRLVDAGVELVLAEGGTAVGLREIARRAGVSHGAPRRHFPTHVSLLSAVAARGFADLGDRFGAALDPAAPPRVQLRTVARVYLAYARRHRGMFELMFRHDVLRSDGRGPGPALRESSLPLFDLVVGLVIRHRADRTVLPVATEPPPAPVTAAALWSAVHGLAQLWTWGSLQLALGAEDAGSDEDAGSTEDAEDAGRPHGPGGATLDALVDAVLDAHLGPVA